MPDAHYILRMDDACPWMDRKRWDRLEKLFDGFGVKPLVAVVPNCADPGLKIDDEDPNFWEKVGRWQEKGWAIALHGYDHVYVGKAKGLVPLNDRTEFAGVPEATQREKIRVGYRILREKGLNPTVWIAPAHTFDKTTLKTLLQETSIRIVSDGLARSPFRRHGMTWVPQQLWSPRVFSKGVWTICLHPNSSSEELISGLESFLKKSSKNVVSIESLESPSRSWGPSDWAFEVAFLFLRKWKAKILAVLRFLRLHK